MIKPSSLLMAFGVAVISAFLATSCAKPDATGPSCSSGQTACGTQCVNAQTDNANCGACGKSCGNNMTCTAGACVCAGGLLSCNGACIASDTSHCGSCTNACATGQVCNAGTCAGSCTGGATMCSDGNCSGAMDSAHCGNSCTMCTNGTTCSGGSCSCPVAGQTQCGSACVDTSINNANCGSCGHACTTGMTCSGGNCTGGSGTAGTSGSGTAGTNGSGTAGTNGSGTAGTNGSGTAGTNGSGTAGTNGTGTGGRGGTTGTAGTTGAGGSIAGNPPGWWTSGTWHGCPWTGIDVLNVGTTNTPNAFTTKNDSFATPYCVSGTVGPDPGYNGVALLGFNLSETSTGSSTQCGYKPADGTAIGPPAITVTGTGIAVNFSKTVGSVLRIQIQDEMGGLTTGGADHRWCYTITEVQGPVFAPFNRFNTKCWDQTGTTFNPATNKIDAVVFGVPGNTIPTPFAYCIGGFAVGGDVSAAPAYNPSPFPTVAGTIGGPGATDLDFQRVKVTPAGMRGGGKQYIIQNNNWGTPAGTDQTITYSGNSFKVVSTTGNVTGAGVPASFPSIYIGNNGDTQNKNDPPKGSYTTKPSDNLPKAISAIGTLNTTAAWSGGGGGRDFNATYDIWLAAPPAPTSQYSDALDAFVMVWLYKPGNRSPIGSVKASAKTIGGNTYNVWAGPRGSGTNTNRPVISYVLTSTSMGQTFDLKPILADAAANATTYGVSAIQTSWLVTDIFFGFEIWTGGDAAGLSVTNFTADVQ